MRSLPPARAEWGGLLLLGLSLVLGLLPLCGGAPHPRRPAGVPRAAGGGGPAGGMTDHAPHPAECFRRAMQAARDMQEAIARAKAAGRPLDPILEGIPVAAAITELAHLAVMDREGLLGPVYDALQLASFTPEQDTTLTRSRRRWERTQPAPPP